MPANRHDISAAGGEFAAYRLAGAAPAGAPELIWAHGWGHSHQALLPLAEAMQRTADSWLVDFGRCIDEAAEYEFILYDLSVMPGAARGARSADEICKVPRAAYYKHFIFHL